MRLSDLKNNDLFVFLESIGQAMKNDDSLVLYRKVSIFKDDNVIHAYTSFNNDGIILCENPPETEVLRVAL